MNQVIWKQTISFVDLRDTHECLWPAGAEILTAAEQYPGRIAIWFRCNPAAPKERRIILIRGTGDTVPADAIYHTTLAFSNGNLILHIFSEAT